MIFWMLREVQGVKRGPGSPARRESGLLSPLRDKRLPINPFDANGNSRLTNAINPNLRPSGDWLQWPWWPEGVQPCRLFHLQKSALDRRRHRLSAIHHA